MWDLERRYRRRLNFRKGQRSFRKGRRPLSKSFRTKKIARDLARGLRYRYHVAVRVHGKSAFKDYGDGHSFRRQRPRREDPVTLKPAMRRELFYVNFPATPFTHPRRSAIMLFPLKCHSSQSDDEVRHGDELLRDTIQRQLQAQRDLNQQQMEQPLAACLPAATLSYAHIVSKVNAAGHPVFHLHLPVEHAVTPVMSMPTHIIAFHPTDDAYAYAVITAGGRVVDVGDVRLPVHVRPNNDGTGYSETYVFELANAMVALAKQFNAFIGLEDTSYLKAKVTTSRSLNRNRFATPFENLSTVLRYKALLAGLPAPHLTSGVRWKHACGQCGPQLPDGVVITYRRPTGKCLTFQAEEQVAYLSVPVLLHASAVVYHLPGVAYLQFSTATLTGIFRGTITHWRDPRIAGDNPGLILPDLPITVIRETDSVSRALCTDALGGLQFRLQAAETDKRWHSGVGIRAHTLGLVRGTEGGIAIIRWTPSLEQDVGIAAIRHGAGPYVLPSHASISAASQDLLVNAPYEHQPMAGDTTQNSAAYFLTGVTWMTIDSEQANRPKKDEAVAFLSWVLTVGSEKVVATGHLPLPDEVRTRILSWLPRRPAPSQHACTQQIHESEENWNDAEKPSRLALIRVTGPGAACPERIYAEWSEQYRSESSVTIVFLRMAPSNTVNATSHHGRRLENAVPVYPNVPSTQAVNDITRRTSEYEWQGAGLWTDCLRCQTSLPTGYALAVVAARQTLNQLVWRHEVVVARRTEAEEAGTPRGGDDRDDRTIDL